MPAVRACLNHLCFHFALISIPRGLCDYEWWETCTSQDSTYATDTSNGDVFFDAFVASFDCNGSELEMYRWIHSLYLFDPDFRAARQMHPFITIVDDHDTDDTAKDFNADSLQAFLEYVPTRITYRPDNRVDLYRSFAIGGDLIDFIALDTRTQVTNTSVLGEDQEAWLQGTLANSSLKNTKWRAIGQTKMFMPFALNHIGSVGIAAVFAMMWVPTLFILLVASVVMYKYQKPVVEAEKKEDKVSHYTADSEKTSCVKRSRHNVKRCWKGQKRSVRCCYSYCLCSFLVLTLLWIVATAMINNLLNSEAGITYLDSDADGWGGQFASIQRLYNQLETENCDTNNIFLSGDMHMSLAADVIGFDETKKYTLLDYQPYSGSNKHYGVEFLPTSGTRGMFRINSIDTLMIHRKP